MTIEKNPILHSLDYIKVYCVLLVILGHVLRMHTANGAFPQQGTWLINQLCNFIYSFHMPLFIAISGIIYGICKRRGKYDTWSNLLQNKSKRLLLPYISFGLFILAPCMIITQLSNNYLNYCTREILLIGKNIRHLWFLICLFQMFIVAHAFQIILDKLKWYTLILSSIIFSALCYYILKIEVFQLNMTITYFPYFLLGYYIGSEKVKVFLTHNQTIYLFIAALLTWGIKYYMPLYTIFISNYVIAFMIILASLNIATFYKAKREYALYTMIKKNSMGVYLYHVIIIYLIYYYNIFSDVEIYLRIIIITLISLFLSIILTYITRKLHLAFMLGEYK